MYSNYCAFISLFISRVRPLQCPHAAQSRVRPLSFFALYKVPSGSYLAICGFEKPTKAKANWGQQPFSAVWWEYKCSALWDKSYGKGCCKWANQLKDVNGEVIQPDLVHPAGTKQLFFGPLTIQSWVAVLHPFRAFSYLCLFRWALVITSEQSWWSLGANPHKFLGSLPCKQVLFLQQQKHWQDSLRRPDSAAKLQFL